MTIKQIAVIGAGLMGKGITHVFALGGYKVKMFGRRDNVGSEFAEYIENEVKRGRVTLEDKDIILNNITSINITSQASCIEECDLIIETVKEDFDAKREIFSEISRLIHPETVLASNTSSYSISRLAEFVPYPENFIGMHFFSPVPLMKLVEVVMGERTKEIVAQEICEIVKHIGKLPVQVKDAPGFVLNRGLLMLINEAVYMFDEKIANSAEDIDNIFINGMGMKVGPLKLADLIGIDVVFAAISNMYSEFKREKYKPCPLLASMNGKGKVGKKAGEGFYIYK